MKHPELPREIGHLGGPCSHRGCRRIATVIRKRYDGQVRIAYCTTHLLQALVLFGGDTKEEAA